MRKVKTAKTRLKKRQDELRDELAASKAEEKDRCAKAQGGGSNQEACARGEGQRAGGKGQRVGGTGQRGRTRP